MKSKKKIARTHTYAQHLLYAVDCAMCLPSIITFPIHRSCAWEKAGLSHFIASKSFYHCNWPNSRIFLLFKTANLNFLRRPLLVFHTKVCNLIVFGMCCLLYFLFYLFWGKVSCSPGRLFNSIVEDDSLPLPPTELGFQVLLSHPSPLMLCWGLYQGFVHSRWAVFQLSHIPSPRLLFYMLMKILCY